MYVTLEPCCHQGKQPPLYRCHPGSGHCSCGGRLRRSQSPCCRKGN
jgi:hypothetical protein